MSAVADGHVGAETLPGPPIFDAAGQDERVVDPHGESSLHGDDELSIPTGRKVRLGVKNAVLHLLVGHGEAAVLLYREHVRDVPAHRVRAPGCRPGPWTLGRI